MSVYVCVQIYLHAAITAASDVPLCEVPENASAAKRAHAAEGASRAEPPEPWEDVLRLRLLSFVSACCFEAA